MLARMMFRNGMPRIAFARAASVSNHVCCRRTSPAINRSTDRQLFTIPSGNISAPSSHVFSIFRLCCVPFNFNNHCTLHNRFLSDGKQEDMLVFSNTNRNYLIASYGLLGLSTITTAVNIVAVLSGYIPENAAAFGYETAIGFAAFCFGFSSGLFLATRLLLSRTFIHIYYNEITQRFLGVSYNWYLGRQQVVFQPGEMHSLFERPTALQLLLGNYGLAGKRYFLPMQGFKSTHHFNLMLGYVKH